MLKKKTKVESVLTMITRQMSSAMLTDMETASTRVFPPLRAAVTDSCGCTTLVILSKSTGRCVTAGTSVDKHNTINSQLRSIKTCFLFHFASAVVAVLSTIKKLKH